MIIKTENNIYSAMKISNTTKGEPKLSSNDKEKLKSLVLFIETSIVIEKFKTAARRLVF